MDASEARAILGVTSSADAGAVAASFRRRALAAHPDAGGDAAQLALLLAARDALLATGPAAIGLVSVTSRRTRRRRAIGRAVRPLLVRIGLRPRRVR